MPGPYNASTTAETVVSDLALHIADKVILVTGVSPGGLGAHFVEQIAQAQPPPKLIILAGRNPAKTKATADAIASTGVPTKLLTLDLETLAGAREAAATVNGWEDVPVIDVLVNNAGIMGVDYAKTVDGFERTFGVNHLAPFLFTNLIVPKLLKSGSPRVVSVSSDGHRLSIIRFADLWFQNGETYDKWRAYGQSKTANILFAVSLAEKLGSKGLTAVSVHPGQIMTNLGNHLNWDDGGDVAALTTLDKQLGNQEAFLGFQFKTPSSGVATHIYGAFEPSLKDHNGAYLQDAHIADPYVNTVLPYALDKVWADRLWKLSEELVKEKFTY